MEIDEKKWREQAFSMCAAQMLERIEKQLYEEFQYLGTKSEKNRQADTPTAGNEAA